MAQQELIFATPSYDSETLELVQRICRDLESAKLFSKKLIETLFIISRSPPAVQPSVAFTSNSSSNQQVKRLESFQQIVVVTPLGFEVSREVSEHCAILHRQEEDGKLRILLLNLLRVDFDSTIKAFDYILKLHVQNPCSESIFGLLRNEACKVFRMSHWVSDAWSAYEESLVAYLGGDPTEQLPDLAALEAERKPVYDQLESAFRLQLDQFWENVKVERDFSQRFSAISATIFNWISSNDTTSAPVCEPLAEPMEM